MGISSLVAKITIIEDKHNQDNAKELGETHQDKDNSKKAEKTHPTSLLGYKIRQCSEDRSSRKYTGY